MEARGLIPIAALALLAGPALASPTVPAPTASEAGPPELEIVGAYLAQTDSAVVMGHNCLRHGGVNTLEETPPLPPPVATNGLMFDHSSWHFRHGSLFEAVGVTPAEPEHYGEDFYLYHHDLVHAYEAWRAGNGHPPLVSWDPATPIPAEFAYPPSPGCRERLSEDPNIPLPAYLTVEGGTDADPAYGYHALCEYAGVGELGFSIDSGWHGSVHATVGGDMDLAPFSPRDPIFWAWHRFVDDVFHGYEAACLPTTTTTADVGPDQDPQPEQGVPFAGAASLMGLLGFVARLMWRRR